MNSVADYCKYQNYAYVGTFILIFFTTLLSAIFLESFYFACVSVCAKRIHKLSLYKENTFLLRYFSFDSKF